MSLQKIAQTLTSVADATGVAQHRLERGLVLTLRHIEGQMILSLTRKGVWPSPKEEDICRKYFVVPKDAERQHAKVRGYKVIRFVWQKNGGLVQKDFLEEAPEKAHTYV